jgi:hypothetical protein
MKIIHIHARVQVGGLCINELDGGKNEERDKEKRQPGLQDEAVKCSWRILAQVDRLRLRSLSVALIGLTF